MLSKLTNFKQKLSEESHHHLHYGHSGTLTRSGLHHDHYGGGHSGTLTRYHKDDHHYYGPIKNLQESDRDLSTSSPVLLEMYDHVKVKTLVVWLTRAIVHFICFLFRIAPAVWSGYGMLPISVLAHCAHDTGALVVVFCHGSDGLR